MPVELLTSEDRLSWWQRGDQDIRLADALDHTSEAAMSVGFARYGAGESNDWTVAYDEALIVTKGRFTVRTEDGEWTAGVGDVIYLYAHTALTYQAEDEDTEVVYVTYPHWMKATEGSPYAGRLNEFRPAVETDGHDGTGSEG